ncbi:conserved hypothetical protein [Vibrio chagasii]|nr:conserved hypothetical protein [Vibrio chagasii]
MVGLCGISAHASSSITIESSAQSSRMVPVVFEFGGKEVDNAISHLSKTKLFSARKGRCHDEELNSGQQVVCVKSVLGAKVAIDVPYSESFVFDVISAKQLASEVYSRSLGKESTPFDVMLAIVTKEHESDVYNLMITDFDGSNPRALLSSPMPILSPSWSPDGKYLSYVSYESYRSAIYVQDVHSGKRLKVFEVRGLNAYPRFKDSNTLLFSVSHEKTGSNIAQFDLITKQVSLVTSSEEHSDVYPVSAGEDVVFVRMFSDIPYLFQANPSGTITQLSRSPSNTPSANIDGSKLVSAHGGIIYIWDMLNKKVEDKLNTHDRIESLSISANSEAYYYVTERDENYSLVAYSKFDNKMFELKTNSSDIIQVSAF